MREAALSARSVLTASAEDAPGNRSHWEFAFPLVSALKKP